MHELESAAFEASCRNRCNHVTTRVSLRVVCTPESYICWEKAMDNGMLSATTPKRGRVIKRRTRHISFLAPEDVGVKAGTRRESEGVKPPRVSCER